MRAIFILILMVVSFSCNEKQQTNQDVGKTIYASSMVFRETPFADIRAARIITKEEVENCTHFELKHDASGRLVEVKYLLNGKLRTYSDRFVRAPFIKIDYKENKEIRTFYNEYGHRTLVSGSVYEVQILLNESGERTQLTFHDINGNLIENDFGIATYKWNKLNDNRIIEYRFDINDQIKRNRPGFGYLITEFQYDKNGLLDKMINLGLEGNQPTADNAGVVSTKIGYDEHGQFIQWLNLDKDNKPIRGMSNIAEIRYIPSNFRGEQDAAFIDEKGEPQTTNWGAHRVVYEFDTYGNEISRKFLGLDNSHINVNNGVGEIKSEWTKDGMYRTSRKYFDKEGNPIEIGDSKIHEFRTKFNDQGNPISTASLNIKKELVLDIGNGYAKVATKFDNNGRIVERRYLDLNEKLVNHKTWGVARFVYAYKNNSELLKVTCYNNLGEEVKPLWNPAH